MAILAALSLAATVLLAQRALDTAADVVVRGDGDAIRDGLIIDISGAEWPVTSGSLTPLLAKNEARGLRYVALVDRNDHHVFAEAGTAAITTPFHLPGEIARKGGRVRQTDALARLQARTNRDLAELTPSNAPPYLVVEFEPPVLERLQGDLRRIGAVAAIAAVVLVAFAFAWSRTMARLYSVQQQAEGERRLVALGRASSVIAHELRNPLAALKGHAQLLLEDLAEPSRAKAARVVESAERMEQLTNVLLDFVRDAPLDLGSVTPADLVDHALRSLPRDRVRVDLSGAPETLHVDEARARLALRNLVRNAVQASEDAAEPVEVRIQGNAHEVVIEVRDHGAGLGPGPAEQIFEPFVTTKAQGTGLGLWIARRIAEQHHGTLTGETHSEGGAVFRLVLPHDTKAARP
jgi:two-component system sensor histidine kinase HydH